MNIKELENAVIDYTQLFERIVKRHKNLLDENIILLREGNRDVYQNNCIRINLLYNLITEMKKLPQIYVKKQFDTKNE